MRTWTTANKNRPQTITRPKPSQHQCSIFVAYMSYPAHPGLGEDPNSYRANMQTPQRKASANQEPSCCEARALTHKYRVTV